MTRKQFLGFFSILVGWLLFWHISDDIGQWLLLFLTALVCIVAGVFVAFDIKYDC